MARRHAAAYLESLPEDQRHAIREHAEGTVAKKTGRMTGFQTFVAIEERRIALTLHPTPTFEEWARSQE